MLVLAWGSQRLSERICLFLLITVTTGVMFLLNQNNMKVIEVAKEGESVSTGELGGPVMSIG